MNEIQIFQNPEFGQVRVVMVEETPWWVLKDVCRALGIEKDRAAAARLDSDERGSVLVDTPGGKQTMNSINESGLYSIILLSRKPAAQKFKRWITHEVLPSIRQTGGYGNQQIQGAFAQMNKLLDVMGGIVSTMCDIVERLDKQKMSNSSPAVDWMNDYSINNCKLESFPLSIRQQVDAMLEMMIEEENLNYSQIARFCTVHGYPISSPSVKTYFIKKFNH